MNTIKHIPRAIALSTIPAVLFPLLSLDTRPKIKPTIDNGNAKQEITILQIPNTNDAVDFPSSTGFSTTTGLLSILTPVSTVSFFSYLTVVTFHLAAIIRELKILCIFFPASLPVKVFF